MGKNDEFYDLAAAILRQAVDDYWHAIFVDDEKQIADLEKFFMSSWGQYLSSYQGDVIIREARLIYDRKIRDEMTRNSGKLLRR